MNRIARSWALAQQSYHVLMKDKELLVLPAISGLIIGILMVSYSIGFWQLGIDPETLNTPQGRTMLTLAAFSFYVLSYTIGFFFQAALIAGALERMNGGDPTLQSALGAASERIGALIAWGFVAGTVGMILNTLQEKSGVAGKIAGGLMGAAWTIATFFVVPVMVMEGRPIGASFKESTRLIGETWGEGLSGSIGFGLLAVLLSLPFVALGAFLAPTHLVAAGLVGVIGFTLVGTIISALQGIFVAALYRYAKDKRAPEGFGDDEFQSVFA